MAVGASESYPAQPALPPDLPARITLPAGTRIPIVLETPLSSRFTQRGQSVVFRTTGAIFLSEDLEVPPGVEIRGRVAEVTRPSAFGKSGALRVTVERMLLPGRSRGQAARTASLGRNQFSRTIDERRPPHDGS